MGKWVTGVVSWVGGSILEGAGELSDRRGWGMGLAYMLSPLRVSWRVQVATHFIGTEVCV